MPVDIMPGTRTGTGPPGQPAAPASGPPGLADLFAALLAQSGSSAPKADPIPADAVKPPSPLSGKPEIGSTDASPITGQAAAEKTNSEKTKNAMDTPPALPSRKEMRVTRRPDGELPLTETRKKAPMPAASTALPVPPVSFPTLPTPALQILTAALPASQARPGDTPAPAHVSAMPASVHGFVPAAMPVPALALPKTFTLTAKPGEQVGEPFSPPTVNGKQKTDILPAPQKIEIRPVTPSSTAASSQPITPLPLPTAIAQQGRGMQRDAGTQQSVIRLKGAASSIQTSRTPPEVNTSGDGKTVSVQVATAVQLLKEAPNTLREALPVLPKANPAIVSSADTRSATGARLIPALPHTLALTATLSGIPKALLPASPISANSPALSAPKTTPDGTAAQKPLKTEMASADNHGTANFTGTEAAPARQPAPPERQPSALSHAATKPGENTTGKEIIAVKETTPSKETPPGKETAAAPEAVSFSVPVVPVTGSKPAVASPLSHAEQTQVVKQAAEGIRAMPLPTRPGTPERITIQLHPKDWGSLNVSVTLASPTPKEAGSGQRTVTAHVVAESRQVKAALENRTGELHQALRASGLHLDRLTVTVQSRAQGEPAAQPANSAGGQTSAFAGNSERGNSAGGQPGSAAFAAFAGNPQGGRHGQSAAPAAAFAAADTEDTSEPSAPRFMSRGQIDTRA